MRRGRPLSKVLVAAAAVSALAAAAGLAGCTDRAGGTPLEGRGSVAPLDATQPSGGSVEPTISAPATTADGRDDPDGHLDAQHSDEERLVEAVAPEQQEQALAVVTEVLDRYGVVLTELAADPALDLGRIATRWASVADPASAFSRDMLGAVASRVRDDQMIIRPGPGGRSYVHRPTRFTTVADDSIGFTWCGYSPGIGVHVVTGEVLDDAVGHASGTGRLVRDGQRWLLDTLDQDQLVALPAGSGDPCVTGGDR